MVILVSEKPLLQKNYKKQWLTDKDHLKKKKKNNNNNNNNKTITVTIIIIVK